MPLRNISLMMVISVMFIVGCNKEDIAPSPDIVATFAKGHIKRLEVENYLNKISEGLEADDAERIRSREVYEGIVRRLAVDYMIKEKIKEKKLGDKKSIKHIMKHITEEFNINELHSQAHEGKIKISEIDIRNYYNDNREEFGNTPLVEAKTAIREVLKSKKEKAYFSNYMEELKKNAVITREYRLLRIPATTEEDMQLYYIENRKKYDSAGQSFKEAKDQLKETLEQEQEKKWFKRNRNKTLFTIDDKRYSVGEFYQELEEFPPNERQKFKTFDDLKILMDRLITRLLVVNETNRQMMDIKNQENVEHARTEILRQILHQEEVDDKLEVSDEEARKFYDKNSDRLAEPPRVLISYIRISAGESEDERKRSEKKVTEAYEKLNPGFWKKGEPFEKIAAEYSEDSETARKGGETDEWISESNNIFDELQSHYFHQVALNLKKGEISRPFEFQGNFYIVKVRKREDGQRLSFEASKESIKQFLSSKKHQETTEKMEENLLKQTNLVIYDEVIDSMLETDKDRR